MDCRQWWDYHFSFSNSIEDSVYYLTLHYSAMRLIDLRQLHWCTLHCQWAILWLFRYLWIQIKIVRTESDFFEPKNICLCMMLCELPFFQNHLHDSRLLLLLLMRQQFLHVLRWYFFQHFCSRIFFLYISIYLQLLPCEVLWNHEHLGCWHRLHCLLVPVQLFRDLFHKNILLFPLCFTI